MRWTVALLDFGTLIGIGMGLLFLGLGIWMVYMGVVGRSPAATMPPAKAKIILMMGVLFAFGGIQAAVKVILGAFWPWRWWKKNR